MPTVDKRKNKAGEIIGYRFRCCVGRDENGKQIWRTKKDVSRPEGLTPKREEKEIRRQADAWEQEEKDEYERTKGRENEERIQARKEKDTITLVDFIDKNWLPKHVNDGKHTPDTVAFYTSMSKDVKSYFNETSAGIKLHQIDKEDVLEYLQWMRTKSRTRRGKPYGATTIKHHFDTLRNILEYAVYVEYLKSDPCKLIKPEDRPKRDAREIDFLDDNEAVRFMTCLDSEEESAYWKKYLGSHLYWRCLCNVFILTGLRRGELVGLQWGDLDEKKMLLNVRRNVTINQSGKAEKDPAKKIHIGALKTKTINKVPITNYLKELLTDYKEEQKSKYGDNLTAESFIFCRIDNPQLPIYPTEPTRQMKKFMARHNLPNMSPHDLRHTAASIAVGNGASVKEVQALLGHKDAATTLKFYAGISERAQRQTVQRIEDTLRPKPQKEVEQSEDKQKTEN